MIIIEGSPDLTLDQWARQFGVASKRLPKEVALVCNRTATKTKTSVVKQVRNKVVLKSAAIKRTVDVGAKATPSRLRTEVIVRESKRISIKHYGRPKQTQVGAAYTISKDAGRAVAPGGFSGPKPGVHAIKLRGHFFKRMGKSRTPIQKLFGPSPWAVFKKHQLKVPTQRQVNAELKKQLARRIEQNVLKRSGVI